LLFESVRGWAEARTARLRAAGAVLTLDDMLSGQLSVRRTVFERLAGFDTHFRQETTSSNEDIDFGQRLLDSKCRVVFNPNAVSWQRYVVTPRQYLKQWRESGRADVRLARKHPEKRSAIFTPRKLRQRRRWMIGPVAACLRWMLVRRVEHGHTDETTSVWFHRVRWNEYWQGVAEAGGLPR
jgi:GT2 family glycosyltransferase